MALHDRGLNNTLGLFQNLALALASAPALALSPILHILHDRKPEPKPGMGKKAIVGVVSK